MVPHRISRRPHVRGDGLLMPSAVLHFFHASAPSRLPPFCEGEKRSRSKCKTPLGHGLVSAEYFCAKLRRILICAPQLGFCIIQLSKFCSARVQFLNSFWLISQDRIGRAARFISPFLNVSQLVGPSKKTVPRMTQDSSQTGTDAAPHLADKERCPSLVPGMSSYESLSQDMGVVKCT